MSKKILLQEEFIAPPIRWENLTQFSKEECITADEYPQEDSLASDNQPSPNNISPNRDNRLAAKNSAPQNNSPASDNKKLADNPISNPPKRIISAEELTTPPLRWEKLPQFKKNKQTPESDGFVSEVARFKAQIAAAKIVAVPQEEGLTITQRHAEAVERGHKEGHSQGFEQGYQTGLLKGQEEGMRLGTEQGRALGIEQGRQEGLVQGQEAGRQEGLAIGSEEGQRSGFTQGHEEGFAAGRAEGCTEGRAQGQEEGRQVGYIEGFAEGRAVGLQQGNEEGRRDGHALGLEEGRRDGHAQGLEQGRSAGLAQGDAELKAKFARLAQFLTALDQPFRELDPIVEEQIVALATLIAKQVITRELQQNSALIVSVVKDALANLPLARRNLRIFLHPNDLPLIQEALADSASEISLIPEPKVTPGGFQIETDNSRIDATVETRLNQVIAQLLGNGQ